MGIILFVKPWIWCAWQCSTIKWMHQDGIWAGLTQVRCMIMWCTLSEQQFLLLFLTHPQPIPIASCGVPYDQLAEGEQSEHGFWKVSHTIQKWAVAMLQPHSGVALKNTREKKILALIGLNFKEYLWLFVMPGGRAVQKHECTPVWELGIMLWWKE